MQIKVDFDRSVYFTSQYFVQGDIDSCAIVADIKQDITNKIVAITFDVPGEDPFTLDMENEGAYQARLVLPAETLAKDGRVNCQISIRSEDYRLTNSHKFFYNVLKSLWG